MPAPLHLYSVVIPARDEEESLPSTIEAIVRTFESEGIPHEIVVVDDGSRDGTWAVLQALKERFPTVVPTRNTGEHGFGRAVTWGFDHSGGDAIVVMKADASDAPEDAARYWALLNAGYECVFGSRFVEGGRVIDYPKVKRRVNRLCRPRPDAAPAGVGREGRHYVAMKRCWRCVAA